MPNAVSVGATSKENDNYNPNLDLINQTQDLFLCTITALKQMECFVFDDMKDCNEYSLFATEEKRF